MTYHFVPIPPGVLSQPDSRSRADRSETPPWPADAAVAAPVRGGRLATVLMYCAAADGGGTAFPNANVHVVPAKGQAVYFHFRGPEPDGVVEDWHTEHSGCPVRSGEKWVVTQWLRDGVSKEFPHHRFDPSGGPIG